MLCREIIAVCYEFSQNCEKRLLASSCLSVCPCVRPSVRMEQLGSNWTDFHEISCWRIIRKSVHKIQLSLKSDKNNRYFTWRPIYNYISSRSFLLRMRNVSNKSCRENQNAHFVSRNFFFENRIVNEIIWKNIVQRGRPQMTIWRMRTACWIPKATNAHSQYVLLIAFPLQRLHERAPMLRYTHIGCHIHKYI